MACHSWCVPSDTSPNCSSKSSEAPPLAVSKSRSYVDVWVLGLLAPDLEPVMYPAPVSLCWTGGCSCRYRSITFGSLPTNLSHYIQIKLIEYKWVKMALNLNKILTSERGAPNIDEIKKYFLSSSQVQLEHCVFTCHFRPYKCFHLAPHVGCHLHAKYYSAGLGLCTREAALSWIRSSL
jgi:hypothetical protein